MERKNGGGIPHHSMFLVKGPDPIKCQSIISKSVEDANTRSPSVPLEKQTSHLLAISIYLTACVWLIWKTQSTCLFLPRNRPLLCNLQVFCNPKRTVLKRTAREARWVLGVDYFAPSFISGEDTLLLLLQWALLHFPAWVTTDSPS